MKTEAEGRRRQSRANDRWSHQKLEKARQDSPPAPSALLAPPMPSFWTSACRPEREYTSIILSHHGRCT